MNYPMSERYAMERMRVLAEQMVECAKRCRELHKPEFYGDNALDAVINIETASEEFLKHTKGA